MIHTAKYTHDTLPLLVTVDRDWDGCEVTRVTAADSKIDISDLFSGNTLASMADCIDAQLTREAQEHNDELRIARHQWHREFCVAAA